MRRGYADAPEGQIHYIEEGAGEALVLLHQTPRSGSMFLQLMRLLADSYRTIAIDLPGYGESDLPIIVAGHADVKSIGRCVFHVLDALDIERAHLFGIHTGAYMAAQTVTQKPERTGALALYGYPFFEGERDNDLYRATSRLPESARRRSMAPQRDGSHLVTLWISAFSHVQRKWLLESGPCDDNAPAEYLRVPTQHRPPFLFITDDELAFIERYITDSRRARSLPEIYAVMMAPSADLLATIKVPTLHINPSSIHESPFSRQGTRIAELIPNCLNVDLPQSDDNTCEFGAPRVAKLLRDFLGKHTL